MFQTIMVEIWTVIGPGGPILATTYGFVDVLHC